MDRSVGGGRAPGGEGTTGVPSYAVILVASTSHAMHAEAALRRAGIECKLIPVPRHISSDCGVCVRVRQEDTAAARGALRSAAVAWESTHDC